MNPKEKEVQEPKQPTELNVSEGAESIQELDWEVTTEQSCGDSVIPIR
ncbi:MAG TPA: hypothetical protein PLX17_00445 [Chitinophagaceae bacterium]|nr:hypothetical protein [Chitinophagaceae bacterium]